MFAGWIVGRVDVEGSHDVNTVDVCFLQASCGRCLEGVGVFVFGRVGVRWFPFWLVDSVPRHVCVPRRRARASALHKP